MAGSRSPRRPSGLDIGRLTEELHSDFSCKVDIATKDMRRWKSREGRAKREQRASG